MRLGNGVKGWNPNDDATRVREATDLVMLIGEHVALKPQGREHVGLCPFHDDHRPSFAVVTHKGNAFYKCHSCGASGDAFTFLMEYHKWDFPEALRHLAERAGIELTPRKPQRSFNGDHAEVVDIAGVEYTSRADLRKANGYAQEFFVANLQDAQTGAAARLMLAERGISEEMVEQFGLGIALDQWDGFYGKIKHKPSAVQTAAAAGLLKVRANDGREGHYDTFRNRLIFPICDESGRPIAFGGRKLNPEDEPKYLNSPESALFHKSGTLYGLHLARKTILNSRIALVTEGYTDVIACHQYGIPNAVATLGTALTSDHARLLGRLCDTIILVFDGDAAGQRAADRAVEVFFGSSVDVKICVLPQGVDPAELLAREGGTEEFRGLLEGARDALGYKMDRLRVELGETTSLSGRQRLMEQYLTDLGRLGFSRIEGVRKPLILEQLSSLLGLPAMEINTRISRAQPRLRQKDMAASIHQSPQSIPVALKRAEWDVLAPVIFEPQLLGLPIVIDESNTAKLDDLLSPELFAHDGNQRIAARLRELRAVMEVPSVQDIMDAFPEQPEVRRLIVRLYDLGERTLGEGELPAAEIMQNAWNSLSSQRLRGEAAEALVSGGARETMDSHNSKGSEKLASLLAVRRREKVTAPSLPLGVRN